MLIRDLSVGAYFKLSASDTHDEIRGIVAAHDQELDLITYIDIDTPKIGMAIGYLEVMEWIN